jgi:hypothetical protein
MKNQYFGDVNDYRKYGLIRLLTKQGEISTAVCWMLTPDDGRTDGKFTDYLESPEKWRRYDPKLFDVLGDLVLVKGVRNVNQVEMSRVLPNALFYTEITPDDRKDRAKYFNDFLALAVDCDLIFFDPDNGLEVKSRPYGRKNSSKYVYWRELITAFAAGHSLLVYQHFPRIDRGQFIQIKAQELMTKTGGREVYTFRTPFVLFLLAVQEHHRNFLKVSSRQVAEAWNRQIQLYSRQGSECLQ